MHCALLRAVGIRAHDGLETVNTVRRVSIAINISRLIFNPLKESQPLRAPMNFEVRFIM